jgi:hypothetical protein
MCCCPLTARGDKILLKSGKSKYGTIESQTDTRVTIVDEAGGKTTFARSQIKEVIVAGVKEEELESLKPSEPNRYFDVGSQYAEDADDPKVRACAEHMLLAAIDLQPDKYAISAHLLLARLAEGPQRAQHLIAVLKLDPKQEFAREQLASLSHGSAEDRRYWDELQSDLRMAQEGRPAPLVNALKEDSKRLATQLAPLWPNMIDDLSKLPVSDTCKICKGRGVRPCSGRRCVKGTVSCSRCTGNGTVPRTSVVMGPSGGGVNVTRETCPSCDGRPKWKCSVCNGAGNNPCTACANRPKTNESLANDVKQKLGDAVQVLGRPSDASWARELIVQDRSAFRGIKAATIDVKTLVKGRYYRRGGEWMDKP